MPGAPDPLYVAARRVLLDALEAIEPHLGAVVLVGAQAVYIHAGEADVAVAPFTTDGDLAIDPRLLRPEPLLEKALSEAGFATDPGVVGIWHTTIPVAGVPTQVSVDLLVPESIGGAGRRGARIPPHGKEVARKVIGLEGALVDRDQYELTAFEPEDDRRFTLAVAGPAALIVAKVHKIAERLDQPDRLTDKDALDIYRVLQAISTEELTRRFALLRDNHLSQSVTEQALDRFPDLFGTVRAPGCEMAVRAAGVLSSGSTMAASMVVLTQDLISSM